jgi:hypothetical protein
MYAPLLFVDVGEVNLDPVARIDAAPKTANQTTLSYESIRN